jgi:hypothetical protein
MIRKKVKQILWFFIRTGKTALIKQDTKINRIKSDNFLLAIEILNKLVYINNEPPQGKPRCIKPDFRMSVFGNLDFWRKNDQP